MTLPWLMHRKQASVTGYAKGGSVEIESEQGESDPAMMAAAEDLLRAINMKDASAVAKALSAAIEMSSPQDMEE